jgi:omega-hydroxy-beta-dihydromenaquinone-9 sulfotransferase
MDFDLTNNNIVTFTPLAGYTLPNIFRLLAQNHFHISPRYTARFTYSLALSTLMTPFYIQERLKYDKTIAATKITKDPVFIIGHWRSGTTYIHNILTRDPQFGFFTTYQTLIPALFITGEKSFKPVVEKSLPNKRPMDNADLGADLPQEDTYAIGALTPYSYYHGWCFPQHMQRYNSYVCMDHASPQAVNDWRNTYLMLLKKITMYYQGKQLILKNPDNTGKIPELLETFPNAKFIYCYRNPYSLYQSMKKFMTKVIPLYCVQTPPAWEDVEELMLSLYTQMTKKYLQDKQLIPKENLVEIRYENFLQQPLKKVEEIYTKFKINDYQKVEPLFKAYLATQKAIQTDNYDYPDSVKKRIEDRWAFALKEYGYEGPICETPINE